MIVVGIFGSMLIVIAGVFLVATLGFVTLDLAHFSGYAAALDATGAQIESNFVAPLVLIQLLSILFAALLNGFVTIGEELGWPGWLLPSLRPLDMSFEIFMTG